MSCHGCTSYLRMTRRQALGRLAEGGGACFLGLLTPELLFGQPKDKRAADAVILLWMGGGMSHIDTFDPQPGTEWAGKFNAIKTAAEGIQISEHFPLLAKQFKDLSVIRSMTSNEADHGRATYLMHTGYPVLPSMQHSTLGSITAKALQSLPRKDTALPPYVNIGSTWAAGYLGAKYAPFEIGNPSYAMQDMAFHQGVDEPRMKRRLQLTDTFDRSFRSRHATDETIKSYAVAYNAALQMMRPQTAGVFDLSREPEPIREAYGTRDFFGQGCLLARRLVEHGVRFVEVSMGGWDTHQQNFTAVERLSRSVDVAVSTLLQDLKSKGLYERTMVILTSEFGRTPRINDQEGRDHFSQVWTTVIGGGGVKGARIIGRSDKGRAVDRQPVRVGELHASICQAMGIDYTQKNTGDGRPFRIVKDENAKPIEDLFKA